MADNMTREQRSRTMSRIRSKNTRAEMMLRRRLHQRGLRYRIHADRLPGKPDIVFTRQKIAVFVDGDFWHGRNFEGWKHKLQPYWKAKIERNLERDLQRTAELEQGGWTVLRIWEHEVKADPDACAERVARALEAAGREQEPPAPASATAG